jgi:hypothetical protein
MSFLRTNYRLTGGKLNIGTPNSFAGSGAVYFNYAGGGSGRLFLVFNTPNEAGTGTYVVLVFSTAVAMSIGDL